MSKPVFEDVFAFRGRRNRKSYALLQLAVVLAWCVVTFPFVVAVRANDSVMTGALALVMLALFVPSTWINFAATGQRCRDFGWTGWAALLVLVPYAGGLFSLALFFIPGTDGDNRYGPDPVDNAHWHGHQRPPRRTDRLTHA